MTSNLSKLALGVGASFIAAFPPAGALAATFDVTGYFNGGGLGLVEFDFSVTNDFTADITDSTEGLVLRKLTSSTVPGDPFPVNGGFGYSYQTDFDSLVFGGLANGTNSAGYNANQENAVDFFFFIDDISTDAPFVPTIDGTTSILSAGPGDIVEFIDDYSFSITSRPAVVPLPAGMPLLMGGLGCLMLLRRKRAG